MLAWVSCCTPLLQHLALLSFAFQPGVTPESPHGVRAQRRCRLRLVCWCCCHGCCQVGSRVCEPRAIRCTHDPSGALTSVDGAFRTWPSSRHGPFTCVFSSAALYVTRIAYKASYEHLQPAYSYLAGCHGRRGRPAGYGRMLQLQLQLSQRQRLA